MITTTQSLTIRGIPITVTAGMNGNVLKVETEHLDDITPLLGMGIKSELTRMVNRAMHGEHESVRR